MSGFAKKEITSLELQGGFIDCVIRNAQDAISGRNRAVPETLTKTTSFLKLKGAQFVLLYKTIEQRDMAALLFKQNFKEKGDYFSQILSDGAQVPHLVGPFEYKGHFGLLVEGLNAYDDSMMDSGKGLYRGIILDPIVYFGESKSLTHEINDRASSILGETGI